MEPWLIENQVLCRLAIFLVIFSVFSAWETLQPWRPWLNSRWHRWGRHFGIASISKITIKLLFPFLTLGAAYEAHLKGLGLLTQSHLAFGVQVILGIIALDAVVYLQHRMMHHFSWLWRIHRVHHMDRHLDVSTGLRFHPFEEILNMAAKILGIAFFGVPVLAVFIFEVWLNAALLFTQLNVPLRGIVEKCLRRVIVTPVMHRIHHSDTPRETNSNFGFCFSWWDKLFGTYVPMPRTGDRKCVIGLEEFRAPYYQTLGNMLLMPFNFRYLKARRNKTRKLLMKT